MQKTLLLLTVILISSTALGEAKVNYRKEINLRNKKIEKLLKDFKDAQKQMIAFKEYFITVDTNIFNNVDLSDLDKKKYSYHRDGRKGIHATEWIATQDELIKNLEKDLKIIQKDMLVLIHHASSAGVNISVNIVESMKPLKSIFKSPFDHRWQNDLYINPEWQYDCSVGAVADVYKIKIFQLQKDKRTLVEVQQKPSYMEAKVGSLSVSSHISLPQTTMVPQNRNTPKNITYYGGMQRNNGRGQGYMIDYPSQLEGKWTIMQFKGFDLNQYSDGEKVELDERCIITGTTTYKTAIGGSNTVFVVEPFTANIR